MRLLHLISPYYPDQIAFGKKSIRQHNLLIIRTFLFNSGFLGLSASLILSTEYCKSKIFLMQKFRVFDTPSLIEKFVILSEEGIMRFLISIWAVLLIGSFSYADSITILYNNDTHPLLPAYVLKCQKVAYKKLLRQAESYDIKVDMRTIRLSHSNASLLGVYLWWDVDVTDVNGRYDVFPKGKNRCFANSLKNHGIMNVSDVKTATAKRGFPAFPRL